MVYYCVAYTPADVDPKAKNELGLIAHQNREYFDDLKSYAKAESIVKKLIKQGHYDIFIDKYDDDGLVDYKGFNQKT